MTTIRRLRIGIDALVTPTTKTGIGRYIDGLLTGLAENDSDQYEFVVFMGMNQTHLPDIRSSRFTFRRVPISTDDSVTTQLWRLFVLPRLIKREGIDVLHVLNEKLLPWRTVPMVMTIHDIADYKYSERCSRARRVYRRVVLPFTVKKADRLIAVSATTKDDLIELLGVRPDRIVVTHEGVSDSFYPQDKHAARLAVASQWGMTIPFVLFVGEVDVRKNPLALVRAIDVVVHQRALQVGLIIAGKPGRGFDDLKREIQRLDLDGAVVLTGYVPDRDLAGLFNAALALVLPSKCEGFGLPAIEAMACITPVIASDSGALGGVVGDAGLLVDVERGEELVNAIVALVSDEELRRRLTAEGLLRCQTFTWKRAAAATLEAYRLACS